MIVYNNFKKGRLGNQLFFVASTIGIAIKNNTEYFFGSELGYQGDNYQKIFEKNLPVTNNIPEKKIEQEKFSYYDIKILENVEIDGYFQSEKFFSHCEDVIRDIFKFKQSYVDFVLSKYPNITDSASIHIRRGDYVNQPNHHPTTPIEYYRIVIDNYFNKYDKIFVFSDDNEWVKDNFKGDKFEFPNFDEDNDLMSFILLSKSKEIAISNSTYSWWAAWLNDNQDKRILAPNHLLWFGPMYNNLETKDIIPEKWTQILI